VLDLDDVTVIYPARLGRPAFRAVHGVTLRVAPGEALGLVGESGSGKTTIGRVAVGLVPVSAGIVRLDGHDLARTHRVRAGNRRAADRMRARPPSCVLDLPRTTACPRSGTAREMSGRLTHRTACPDRVTIRGRRSFGTGAPNTDHIDSNSASVEIAIRDEDGQSMAVAVRAGTAKELWDATVTTGAEGAMVRVAGPVPMSTTRPACTAAVRVWIRA
jgi:energy-coupling factor transporter ATP-binding protein EcfA2